MIGQARINDGHTIAETLGRTVANGNDFRSIAIDVAPSPFAFDCREILGKGLRGFKAGRDYGFSAIIDKSPSGSQRSGKERARTRCLFRRLMATARGEEQRENEGERDRTAAIHPSAKIM